MSIALLVTRGFGNGTVTGSIKDVVTRGYGIAVGKVYFFRTDGTAATLAACTGPATVVANCGDQTLLENSTFSQSDVVNISSLGVAEWANIDLDGADISGANGYPVVIEGDEAFNTVSGVSDFVLRLDGLTNDVEWVTINNFWAQNSDTGADTTAVVIFRGNVGVAANGSINITNGKARNLAGDGYSQLSGGSGHIRYNTIDVSDCGSALTGGSNNALTGHSNTQSAEAWNLTASNCYQVGTFVGGSTLTLHSGTVDGGLDYDFKSEGNATYNSTINLESDLTWNVDAGGKGFDCNSYGRINFNGATFNVTNAVNRSYIRASALVTINGGSWDINSATFKIQTFTSGSMTARFDSLVLRDYDVFIAHLGTGDATIDRSFIDFTNLNTNSKMLRVTDASATATVKANVFKNIQGLSSGERIGFEGSTTGANLYVGHNTVWNSTSSGEFIRDQSATGSTLESNIFENVLIVDGGTTVNADYNCYYNSDNQGGANSITTDPLLVAPASNNFKIPIGSPCRETGNPSKPVATDYAGRAYASPPSMGALEYFNGSSAAGLIGSSIDLIPYSIVDSIINY